MRTSKDVFSEVVTGVFMASVLALMAYFTIVISGADVFNGRKTVDVEIEFDDVGGLKERDSVMYRGAKVGTVERIRIDEHGISLIANVSQDVVLRTKYRICVTSLSLLGGNYLLLEEGAGERLPLKGTVFRGERPTDWMRDLGDIARNLRDITSGGGVRGIVTNLEQVAANANVVMARVERGEGLVGKLLSTNETLYADFEGAVASVRSVADRVERGEGTVGRLLSSDDTVYLDLKRTLANAAEVAGRIAAGEGAIGRLTSTNDTVYADLQSAMASVRAVAARMERGDGLLGRLSADEELAGSASKLLKNLEEVSARLAEGRGTLGRLASDDELYTEISGLMKDVRQIVDNYRDTTPITTFGSLIMGGL